MKKLTLPRLRSLAPQPKKKVRKLAANAAHRLTPPAFEDYDEEPTTKLSTAFVVVLVLHLVAVGGIYAFHSIKTHRRQAEGATAMDATVAKKTPPAAPVVSQTAPTASAPIVAKVNSVPSPNVPPAISSQPVKPIVAGKDLSGAPMAASQVKPGGATVPAPVVPVANGSHPDATPAGKPYVVVRGDNPTTIAKRLGVSENELLKMNGIDDPKKLQIGQVLKVPAKKAAN